MQAKIKILANCIGGGSSTFCQTGVIIHNKTITSQQFSCDVGYIGKHIYIP